MNPSELATRESDPLFLNQETAGLSGEPARERVIRRSLRSRLDSSCDDGLSKGDGIVGSSRALQAVLQLARTVAPVDSTVVIQGEKYRQKKCHQGKECIAARDHRILVSQIKRERDNRANHRWKWRVGEENPDGGGRYTCG
jgi:transcriptional regulator with AAA-type ATPase domain